MFFFLFLSFQVCSQTFKIPAIYFESSHAARHSTLNGFFFSFSVCMSNSLKNTEFSCELDASGKYTQLIICTVFSFYRLIHNVNNNNKKMQMAQHCMNITNTHIHVVVFLRHKPFILYI